MPSNSTSLPTPAEILACFYEEETKYIAMPHETRDFANTMGRYVSPEIQLTQSPDLPWGGVYHGHDGFTKWSDSMAFYFSSLNVIEPRLFERQNSNEILILSTLKLVIRSTGDEWNAPLTQSMTVDREKGWITEIRPFYWNVAGLNKALGTE